jgi:cardiolipin synthase A/B
MPDEIADAVSSSIWSHLLTVGGFILAVFAIARLMSERRQPSNTIAWILGIVLIPYIGVPMYLLLSGKKIRRLAALKSRMKPRLPGAPLASDATLNLPAVHAMVANGVPQPVGGNRVRLITTGEQAFAELEARIRAAKESIHITTFILGRDETGKRIIRLLAAQARRGVKVRLLLDGLGCFLASRGFSDPLRQAGGDVARFMPVAPLSTRYSANLRNHRKIAIFDQRSAYVGGHNLARDYMGPKPWRKRFNDFGAMIDGPAVGLLNEIFLADWAFASGQSLDALRADAGSKPVEISGEGEVQVIASGPDVHGDPLYEGIVSLIQEAERSVWIITPYFIPDEVLQRSLLVKARSGKDVTLIVPEKSNHPVTDFARRQYLRDLHEAGARVLFFRPKMLHSKALIVDDRIGLLGSANFDLRSLFVNFEIGVTLYSESDVRAMRVWAGELVRQSVPFEPDAPRKRKWLGDLAEDLSRLLAPLL